MLYEVKMWRRNALGLGTWRVYGLPPDNRSRGRVVIMHASTEGGSEISHVDDVFVNKSGRTIEEQMKLEIDSRCSRMRDKGYKLSREEALQGATNQLGLINPMLAQKVQDVRLTAADFAANGAFVQPKYDGHRCLVTKRDGDMLAYSRKGKPIETIGHVLEQLYPIMQDGDTFDGELYVHGQPLQAISSLIKRDQAGSRALTFRWYDLCDLKRVFRDRYNLMVDLHASVVDKSAVQLTPTGRVDSMSKVYDFFRKCRQKGYEGAMLRLSRAGYETARRASQLLKVKEREDCEVTTIGCKPSARGWAVLRVRADWGAEFDVSAPGSVDEKVEVLKNYEERYHNRRLTVEYACLTTERVPFHCVAVRWHEEV
ncbi:MAG TPA: hypothetical protein P5144_14715 [Thermoanaerobaculia bacterium]|nr:hypothetical protein [Thermoanaerobaculia bacterium]